MPSVGVLVSGEASRPEKTFWVRPEVLRELQQADREEVARTEGATSTGEYMLRVLQRYLPEGVVASLRGCLIAAVVKLWLPMPVADLADPQIAKMLSLYEAEIFKPAPPKNGLRIWVGLDGATATHCGDGLRKCQHLILGEETMHCAVFGASIEYDEENPERRPERLPKCRASALAD